MVMLNSVFMMQKLPLEMAVLMLLDSELVAVFVSLAENIQPEITAILVLMATSGQKVYLAMQVNHVDHVHVVVWAPPNIV